jgi:transposase
MAKTAEEDVIPASEYRVLQNHVKELQRLLGKKTMEGEFLKEALEIATGQKISVALALVSEGGSRSRRCARLWVSLDPTSQNE